MPLTNYTTQVQSRNTATEIVQLLSDKKARQIVSDYDGSGKLTGIAWSVEAQGRTLAFRLPANMEAVWKEMQRLRTRNQIPPRFCNYEQAERIAWRNVLLWVKAQMAMIETGQITLPEAFFAYAITANGDTLYHSLESRQFPMLGEGAQP